MIVNRPLQKFTLCFVLISLSSVGCGLPSEKFFQGRQSYYANQFPMAVEQLRADENRDDNNTVLYNLYLAAAAMGGGDAWDAERALLTATKIMNSDAGKGRGALSLISAESLKLFKGEPFEKAMAFFYLGIIYYNRADYENARAAFNQALLMDKQSEEGFREDLRLVFFMLGKTLLRLNDNENARIAFDKANARHSKEALPANRYYDLELAKQANLTVLIELGAAPEKIRQGPGAAMDDFVPRRYPERQVDFSIDGKAMPAPIVALDLAYEAKHRGRSGKDAVQAGKGIAREAAVATAVISDKKEVKLGALLFALANQSQADIRQWELLPGEIHVFSGKVAAGLRTLKLDFTGGGGQILSDYQQVWYYIPVEEKRERIYLFRAARYKGDGSYLLQPVQANGMTPQVLGAH